MFVSFEASGLAQEFLLHAGFRNPALVSLLVPLSASLPAWAGALLSSSSASPVLPRSAPLRAHLAIGVLLFLSFHLTSLAPLLMSYPAFLAGKAAKLLPTMAIGTLWLNKHFDAVDWLAALLTAAGLALALGADPSVHSHASSSSSSAAAAAASGSAVVGGGALILGGALVFDGAATNAQSALLQQYAAEPKEIAAYAMGVATLLAAANGLLFGGLLTGLDRVLLEPRIGAAVAVFAVASFLSNVAVLTMLRDAGAASTSFTSTVCKALVIVVSYALFPKPVAAAQVAGMSCVLLSVALAAWGKTAPAVAQPPQGDGEADQEGLEGGDEEEEEEREEEDPLFASSVGGEDGEDEENEDEEGGKVDDIGETGARLPSVPEHVASPRKLLPVGSPTSSPAQLSPSPASPLGALRRRLAAQLPASPRAAAAPHLTSSASAPSDTAAPAAAVVPSSSLVRSQSSRALTAMTDLIGLKEMPGPSHDMLSPFGMRRFAHAPRASLGGDEWRAFAHADRSGTGAGAAANAAATARAAGGAGRRVPRAVPIGMLRRTMSTGDAVEAGAGAGAGAGVGASSEGGIAARLTSARRGVQSVKQQQQQQQQQVGSARSPLPTHVFLATQSAPTSPADREQDNAARRNVGAGEPDVDGVRRRRRRGGEGGTAGDDEHNSR
jgi:drug/metabolite transporter (DMT)-like permease